MFNGAMVPRFLVIAGGGGSTVPTITANTTVLVPTDYPTLDAAIAFAETNLYVNGAILTIEVEPGHVVTGTKNWIGKNLPNVSINFNGAPTQYDGSTLTGGFGFLLDKNTSFNRVYGQLSLINTAATLWVDAGANVEYGDVFTAGELSLDGAVNAIVVVSNRRFLGNTLVFSGSVDLELDSVKFEGDLNGKSFTRFVVDAANSTVTLGNINSSGILRINGDNSRIVAGVCVGTTVESVAVNSSITMTSMASTGFFPLLVNGSSLVVNSITTGDYYLQCSSGSNRFNSDTLSYAPTAPNLARALFSVTGGELSASVDTLLTVDGTSGNPTRLGRVEDFAKLVVDIPNRSFINGASAYALPYLDVPVNYLSDKSNSAYALDAFYSGTQSIGAVAAVIQYGITEVTMTAAPTSVNLDSMGTLKDAEILFYNNSGGAVTLVAGGATVFNGPAGSIPAGGTAIVRRDVGAGANNWRIVSRQ